MKEVFEKVLLLQKSHGKFKVPIPDKSTQVHLGLSADHVFFKVGLLYFIYDHSGRWVGKGSTFTPTHTIERLTKDDSLKLSKLQTVK